MSDERADWSRVAQVYAQCLAALEGDDRPYLPAALTGFLAEVLSRASASYYQHEDALVDHALRAFGGVSGDHSDGQSFEDLYRDGRFTRLAAYASRDDGTRRRPTPFEATVETARRLRDLNALERATRTQVRGCILGGSASYGRFYNVMGALHGDASDLDVLLVLAEDGDVAGFCEVISQLEGVSEASCKRFAQRAADFLSNNVSELFDPIVFSGKLSMWSSGEDPLLDGFSIPQGYHISCHIVTERVLDHVLISEVPRFLRDDPGIQDRRLVKDYREKPAERYDQQRNLRGGTQQLSLSGPDGGGGSEEHCSSFIRTSHVYFIGDDDDYYPGMFQNLVLPQFDVRWGDTALRRSVEAFRWKMVDRLRYEARVRPNDFLRLSLSHTRSEVFSPHVVRAVDQSTVLS